MQLVSEERTITELERRKTRPKYLPFGYKLMLTFILFIIIPVSIIGFVSHSMYEESIRKQTRVNIQGTLMQIVDNIEFKTMDIKRISDILYKDQAFIGQLRVVDDGYSNLERITKVISPKLDATINSTSIQLWLSIFFHNKSIPEIYKRQFSSEATDKFVHTFDMYHINRIANKPWYVQFPKEEYEETMQWQQIEQDKGNDRISLLRRIIDPRSPIKLKESAFIRINVQIADLLDSANYAKIGEGSVLYIKNEYGTIMHQSGTLKEEVTDLSEPGDNYLVIKDRLQDLNWELVALIPTTIMDQNSFKVKVFIITMCILCSIIFLFIGLFISRYFSVRIMKIISILNAFREGDLHKRMNYRGSDEFTEIADALNEMGENIGDLIKEVYLTQIQKKEAELETLQSQINPHFLYNTLSSISRLSKFGESEKLQQMVMELAKFYRLTLNEGRTMIPVHLEIDQARAYLVIQQIKYMDRMDVMWDIDVDVWPYETIKLILQPFLENVLEHAWCGDRIHIRVVGRVEGECIRFRIIDDGVGMSMKRIKQIFDSREHVNGGYGIRNVEQRIKLQYGPSYGVTISSIQGIGTSVDITIPAKKYVR